MGNIQISKLRAEDVEKMTLVVFSDMQIDEADPNMTIMYANIEEKYYNIGMEVCGQPYKPPHILFWNLRSTTGFPVRSNQKNCSMMSGFSPRLLNLFCEGPDALNSCTPFTMFKQSLENKRYQILQDEIQLFLHPSLSVT